MTVEPDEPASSMESTAAAAPVEGDEDGASRLWLLCRTGAVQCALSIERVIEITRPQPIERIASGPQFVLGLSIIRGTPTPVVDLGLIIGSQPGKPGRLLIVKTAPRTIALAVEHVAGIATIEAGVLGRLPPLLQQTATETIAAIGSRDDALLVFLNAGRLVPAEPLAHLNAPGATS